MSPVVGRGPGGRGGGSEWTGERASKGTRGRNLRGLLRLMGPTARARSRRSWRSCLAQAPRSRHRCWPRPRSTKGSTATTRKRSCSWSSPSSLSALVVWAMTYAQTYLVGWVGQRALADLRIRIFTHLQTLPIGFYESRPAGVLISRMTNDVEALDSLVTDSVVTLFQSGLTLLGTVGILLYPRRQARAADVLRPAPGAGRLAVVSDRLRRRLPAHARDDRRDHRLPAGDPVGHPRGAQLRPGASARGASSPSSTRTTATPT